MKKSLAVVLSLVLTFGTVLGMGLGASATEASAGEFLVGYGVADMTPDTVTGLAMAGFHDDRTSTGVLDALKATCIAMTDEAGKTVLFIGADLIQADKDLVREAKQAITAKLDVSVENIYINASHTHSGVDLSVKSVRTAAVTKIADAAVAAYNDRTPITAMKTGAVQAQADFGAGLENMNAVRHYQNSDGTYVGDNFGTQKSNPQQVYDADNNIYLLQFTFADKQPVVLAGYRAHATLVSAHKDSNGNKDQYTLLSSDYIGPFRDAMETAGYRTAFLQGAAGNINPNNREEASALRNISHTVYGQALASCALNGLGTATAVPVGQIRTTQIQLLTDYPWQEGQAAGEQKFVNYMQQAYPAQNGFAGYKYYNVSGVVKEVTADTTMYEMAKPAYDGTWNRRLYTTEADATSQTSANSINPYESKYIINSVVEKYEYYLNRQYSSNMEINGISIGSSVAFVTAPVELFHTSGRTGEQGVVETSAIAQGKTLFVLGYTNGNRSYVPDNATYNTYDSYEEWVATTKQGTYEQIHGAFMDALTQLEEAVDQPAGSLKAVYIDPTTKVMQHCECGNKIVVDAQGTVEYRSALGADGCKRNGTVGCDGTLLSWSRKTDTAAPAEGATVYLDADLTLTAAWSIKGTTRIDLNGHTVTTKLNERFATVWGRNRHLILTDSSVDNSGKILGNGTKSGSGGLILGQYDGGATFTITLYGGTLMGGTSTGNGGNLSVEGGTLNVFPGVTICGGTAAVSGGNIHAKKLTVNPSIHLYGGAIRGGLSSGTADTNGGGNIYAASTSNFVVTGDTLVIGGTAAKRGGNIWADCLLEIGGNAKILLGKASTAVNIANRGTSGRLIKITGSPVIDSFVAISGSHNLTTAPIYIEGSPVIGPFLDCTENYGLYLSGFSKTSNVSKVVLEFGKLEAGAKIVILPDNAPNAGVTHIVGKDSGNNENIGQFVCLPYGNFYADKDASGNVTIQRYN